MRAYRLSEEIENAAPHHKDVLARALPTDYLVGNAWGPTVFSAVNWENVSD